MKNNLTQNTNEINEKPLKTWDEAIKELTGFIQKTKADETKEVQKEK